MKLALIGYGKMGRMLEQLAPEYGFEVALILDVHNNADGSGITAANFAGIDAAIEFSTPEAAVSGAPTTRRGERLLPRRREAARLLSRPARLRRLGLGDPPRHQERRPSGTLLKLVDEMKRRATSRNIDVASNRAGRASRHARDRLRFAADTITLRHAVRSREGFARGALKAAQWVTASADLRVQRGALWLSRVDGFQGMRNGAGYPVPKI
jgi:4-hydroxy-tetrahydrodipicolinate reductase